MTDLFKNYGIHSGGFLWISPREALELLGHGAYLVDLRDTDYSDYKAFEAPHVISLPAGSFEEKMAQLEKNAHYILADPSGIHIRAYAEKMVAAGFPHVAGLSGGFVEWERDGMPVRVDVQERLTGACACQLKPREKKKT